MKLIIGLGNPGEKYAGVRHNLGFAALEALVKQLGVQSSWIVDQKTKSEIIEVNHQLVLAKPLTFMNNSGLAVELLTTNYQLPTTNLIVIHDDLDLPLGKIKIRLGGAAAGHHGVESIINALGSDQFIRVRLGIGNLKAISGEHRKKHFNAEKYVLEPFLPQEHAKVKHMIKQAIVALELLLKGGLTVAQNQFN